MGKRAKLSYGDGVEKKPKSQKQEAIFFACFESHKQKSYEMRIESKKTSTKDFYDWIKEQISILEKESGQPFIVVNCNIIR